MAGYSMNFTTTTTTTTATSNNNNNNNNKSTKFNGYLLTCRFNSTITLNR